MTQFLHQTFKFLLVATLLAAPVYRLQAEPFVSPELYERAQHGAIDVIVQFEPGADEADTEQLAARGLRRLSARTNLRSLRGGAAALTVGAGELARLASDPGVRSVTQDYEIHATLHTAGPTTGAAVAQLSGYLGKGIGIAVIDSGVARHRDFGDDWNRSDRVVYRQDFTGSRDHRDDYGHGTHVAGIIAGNGSASLGSRQWERGLAPGARIVDLRVLNELGVGRDSYVIAAIQRAIELKRQYNIRVINLSLGRPVFLSYKDDPLCDAVKAAWEAGIVVVAAAGNSGREDHWENDGYGTISAPGNSPYAITVGAMKPKETWTRWDDEIASYSSKGPTLVDHVLKPDLVAPGNLIVAPGADDSTLVEGYPEIVQPRSSWFGGYGRDDSGYVRLSGTSMAAPMVSAAAALLLDKRPELSPDQVKAILMRTASKSFPSSTIAVDPASGVSFQSNYDVFTVGAGYLDIAAALAQRDMPSGSALSPLVAFDDGSGVVSLITSNSVLWGRSVVWGTRNVWGSAAIGTDGLTINGTGVVWGGRTGSMVGFSVLWGRTSPWGTAVIWGQHDSMEAMNVLINGEE